MPHTQGPTSVVLTPIPLGSKLRMRFYEPLVLLLAATQACMHNLAPRVPEPSPNRWNQSLEQLFHDFMNKLAQICDTHSKAPTVTAVVAISHPDRVEFRFASNQRSTEDLVHMKAFVTDVLETLRDWTEITSALVQVRILRKVIAFTRPRLEKYVKAVASSSETCLQTGGLAPDVAQRLRQLHSLSSGANDQELDEDTFFRSCVELMESIRKLSRSSSYRVFRNKANSTQNGQNNPWAEMRHAAGRLLSYFEGVQTLIEAREQPQWAQLFHEFEIVCLPSSEPHPNPIVGQRRNAGAADILGRMTSAHDTSKLTTFQDGAAELQRFGLDENIRKQTHSRHFSPIVHAEILVHESLVDADDLRFFEGYRYIGTSKPTCRLCDYFFRAMSRTMGDCVQVRQSHGNLYLNWRAPDVYSHQLGAVKRREDILNEMIVSVRQDTYRTLKDKIGERKRFDSNTSRTYNRGDHSVEFSSVTGDDRQDLASMMGQVSLED